MASYQNFQVNRNKNKNSVNIFGITKSKRKEGSKSDRMMEGIAVWTSFYRANPHRFVRDYLGIELKLFQQILLWAMMHFHFMTYIASRGQGKTFLTAIFCVTRAILYPESKIIASAGQKSQAREIVQKIDDLRKNSPLLQREISNIKISINDSGVEFHCGSWIQTVASNDGARGKRSNLLIVDEYRLVDIDIINTVLRKFQTAPRQPKFLNKPEYKDIDELKERNKEIYLSSAFFKSHHTYERVESYTNSMVNGKSYFVCSLPYQIAIKEGLLMRDQVEDEMQELTFNEVSWLMEMEALFYGQSTKSIFKFEDLHKSRKLGKLFYPKETSSLINDKTFAIPRREAGEIRVISADIAVMAGSQNDATALTIARLVPKKDGYDREIVYLETLEGTHTGQQALRIKQLFYDFDCQHIVLDRAGAGIGVYDALAERTLDNTRGIEYEPFSCQNNEELAKRCMYPNAPKYIFAIHGTAELNSEIAIRFKDSLSRGKVVLPVIETEGNEFLMSSEKFKKLPQEIKERFKLPYVQTTLLINEIINLEAEINETGRIKLKEAKTARKDRYSSISYLNYFATELEVKNRKKKTDIDPSKLFLAKQAKRY